MKRFWLVLLSLGLVMAFSAQAFAVDVKFSGSYYAAGMYLDKTSVADVAGTNSLSTAFFFQRLRLQTEFVVSPGLSLITRFDAMERAWGAPRSTPGTALDSQSAGTTAENENIAFDLLYLQYASPIGTFRVGYMLDLAWGTLFMDSAIPRGKVAWGDTTGPWSYGLQIAKSTDSSYTAKNTAVTTADTDNDKYCAYFKYTWKSGEAGMLAAMYRDAANRPATSSKPNSSDLFYGLLPYAVAQIGPVKVQAEVTYFWGNSLKYDNGVGDVKLDALAAFFDATADFGMFYAGGTFAYVSGDDPTTTDKAEGFQPVVNGGRDWNPCLIMWNNDRYYWAGALSGYSTTTDNGPMYNAWFGQIKGGVRPLAALNIMASVSYATADKKYITGTTTPVVGGTYGTEVDVTATYKITNNLSYMLGVGYLFTGDYYKGTVDTNQVANDYLVINKLTLTF